MWNTILLASAVVSMTTVVHLASVDIKKVKGFWYFYRDNQKRREPDGFNNIFYFPDSDVPAQVNSTLYSSPNRNTCFQSTIRWTDQQLPGNATPTLNLDVLVEDGSASFFCPLGVNTILKHDMERDYMIDEYMRYKVPCNPIGGTYTYHNVITKWRSPPKHVRESIENDLKLLQIDINALRKPEIYCA